MGKFYWGFLALVVGLLIYAGTTGNFGIIPKLPFELPSRHSLVPQRPMMNTYILGSTATGQTYPASLTVAELQEELAAGGADIAWDRTADNVGWLLKVSGVDDMTDKDTTLVFRLEYRAKGGPSGGPITFVTDVVHDSEYLDDYDIQSFLQQLAADFRSRRSMLGQRSSLL